MSFRPIRKVMATTLLFILCHGMAVANEAVCHGPPYEKEENTISCPSRGIGTFECKPFFNGSDCEEACTLIKCHDNPPSIGPAPKKICPWSPNRVTKPAVQCGFSDIGLPKPGLYDCGLVTNSSEDACENHCVFVECLKI